MTVDDRLHAARPAIDSALDWVFFIIGGLATGWLAYLLFQVSFEFGWWQIVWLIVFWIMLTYLVLPRLHRILTRIYLPDYFIGRARTSDGLLGDPVNLALLGSEAQIHEVMTDAGWTLADDLTLATGWRTVTSTVRRRSYLEAPVSPLLLFGRKQDFAYQQEVDGSPGKRHHVRFWRCPEGWKLPGGHAADWLAAGTFDRSVGLSLFTLQVTHKIEADTDVERDYILDTVTRADPAVRVTIIEDFSTGYHARNGGGDRIKTDGDLPVIDLRGVHGPLAERDAEPTDSRDKRPSPIAVGAFILAVRAVVAAILGIELLTTDTEGDADAYLFVEVLGIAVLAFAVIEAFLAWRVFLGKNWARLVAMALSTIAIVAQAIGFITGGTEVTLQADLPGLALDILLILALSSERALTWARRARKAPKRIASRTGGTAPF